MHSNEFMNDINSIAFLTSEEANTLIYNIKNNIQKEISKNRLITGLWKSMYIMVEQIEYEPGRRIDLLQDGAVILLENLESYIEKYNSNKGSFYTYANRNLRNALILQSWKTKHDKIGVCKDTYELMKRASNLYFNNYSYIKNEKDRIHKIAKLLNKKEHTILNYIKDYTELKKTCLQLSLETLIFDNENSNISLKDTLSSSLSPEEIYFKEDDFQNSLLDTLSSLLDDNELKIAKAYMYNNYANLEYSSIEIVNVLTNIRLKLHKTLNYNCLEILCHTK